jgi:Ca2+-binding RTX toxin-like protein
MTTTPTIWKPEFTANAKYTKGLQYMPQTIGLANGNFLTVWTDDQSGTTYNHVLGRFFDPEGNPLGERMQFSQAAQPISEYYHASIAAMPDGGFVLAYLCGTNDDIMVKRFDSAGSLVATRVITDNDGDIREPSITVDRQGNYIVAFMRYYDSVGLDIDYDTRAVVFNHISNNELDEFSASITNDSWDKSCDVAAFTNGNIVAVNRSDDLEALVFDDSGIYCQISDTGTGAKVKTFHVADGDKDEYVAPHVAVLTSGRFVVTFEHNRGDVYFRIGSSGTAAATLGSRVTVASGNNDQAYSDVVALQDGGFFVVWHDVTADTLYGKRYNSNGVLIGDTMTIVSGLAVPDIGHGIGNPVLALTDDGRILLTFRNEVYKISQMILDPRDTYIVGTAAGEAITGQTSASLIFGGGGRDRIFGQAGNDTIDGGAGADLIRGGDGDDTIFTTDRPADRVDGGEGYDAYLVNIADTRLILDLALQKYSLDPSGTAPTTSNGILGIEFVRGSTLADSMTGDAGDNRLEGRGSDDTLRGGGGDDDLRGGGDNDFLEGGNGKDSLDGGSGTDTADYSDKALQVEVILNGSTNAAVKINGVSRDTVKNIENLIGSSTGDKFTGDGFANKLDGQAGADTLVGGGGNDTLTGGAEIDNLTGGANDDVFRYLAVSDSTPAARDIITDFDDSGNHRIDVSALFGPTMAYQGTGAFTAAGQVRVAASGADVIVEVNTVGTSGAELSIKLSATAIGAMGIDDFIL